MNQLLSKACTECGYEGPASLTVCGLYIRRSCGACGQDAGYVEAEALPTITDIKRAIVSITCEIDYIQRQKVVVGFSDQKVKEWIVKSNGTEASNRQYRILSTLEYHRLYKHIYAEAERRNNDLF